MDWSISMLADPVGTTKANIQAYVGVFLTLKAKLLPLTLSGNQNVATAASQYMATQEQLEGELPGILNTLNTLSLDTIFSTTGLQVTNFSTRLVNHVNNVNSFLGANGGVVAASGDLLASLGITNQQLLIGGAIAGAGMVMGKTMLGVIGGIGFIMLSKQGVI